MKKDYFLKGFVILLFFLFSDFGFGQTYCIPTTTYYYYQVYITNVALSGETTPPANASSYLLGHQDFTGLTPKCEQYPGKDIAVTITPSMDSRIKSWVDWNKDGDFVDDGEQVYDSGGATASGDFDVSIPPETLPGDYRIRVRNLRRDTYYPTMFSDYPDFTACENFHYIYIIWVDWKGSYGEAEDYTITVLDCKKEWTGAVDENWTTPGNWSPSGVPTENHCVESSSGTIIVNGNGNAKSVTLTDASALTITSSNNLTVENEITIGANATFIIDNCGSLIQNTETINSGNLIIKRNTFPMKRFDFTYWSSPVASQNLYDFSPFTLFNKYFSWNPSSGWVGHLNGAATMQLGKGYIIRAPQSFPTDSTDDFEGTFEGVPNNGEIAVPDFAGSDTDQIWNLIGNPYPSAIDIDLFIDDPDNTEVGGTIYVWTHNTPIFNSGFGLSVYTANDYAAYTRTGGVATAAAADANDPTDADDNNSTPVDGIIASGQSFFIRGLQEFEDLDAPLENPVTVKFKNYMRVLGNNSNFYKPSASTPVENWEMTGKHRLWISLQNSQGAFNQALVGYVQGATDGLDRLYDGQVFWGSIVSLYSTMDQTKLTIQGKALPFNAEDVVPLGYRTTIAGNFHISLDQFDGLFSGQDIFLKDKVLNVVHDLKGGTYSFASTIGTFDDRFEIVYTNQALGNHDPEFNAESIIVYKNSGSDIAVNSGLLIIDEVKIYDISGRLITHKNKVNNNETLMQNLPLTQQVLIVEVVTNEGFKVARKIIF